MVKVYQLDGCGNIEITDRHKASMVFELVDKGIINKDEEVVFIYDEVCDNCRNYNLSKYLLEKAENKVLVLKLEENYYAFYNEFIDRTIREIIKRKINPKKLIVFARLDISDEDDDLAIKMKFEEKYRNYSKLVVELVLAFAYYSKIVDNYLIAEIDFD